MKKILILLLTFISVSADAQNSKRESVIDDSLTPQHKNMVSVELGGNGIIESGLHRFSARIFQIKLYNLSAE